MLVDVERIRRSVQLVPCFGKKLVESLSSNTVLDKCDKFYVNRYTDKHAFVTMR